MKPTQPQAFEHSNNERIFLLIRRFLKIFASVSTYQQRIWKVGLLKEEALQVVFIPFQKKFRGDCWGRGGPLEA